MGKNTTLRLHSTLSFLRGDVLKPFPSSNKEVRKIVLIFLHAILNAVVDQKYMLPGWVQIFAVLLPTRGGHFLTST